MLVILGLLVLVGFAVMVYGGVGVLFPSLPWIRTRLRGLLVAGAGFVGAIILAVVLSASIPPEMKEALDRQRAASEQAAVQAARADEAAQAGERQRAEEREAATWAAAAVSITTLLQGYEANEVAADSVYKGRKIQVSGLVAEVKKDILDRPYVILGTGAPYEVRQVQCVLAPDAIPHAAALRKGERATVRGTVDGLMLHVQMRGCTFAP